MKDPQKASGGMAFRPGFEAGLSGTKLVSHPKSPHAAGFSHVDRRGPLQNTDRSSF